MSPIATFLTKTKDPNTPSSTTVNAIDVINVEFSVKA
jgi:hypothetical protein